MKRPLALVPALLLASVASAGGVPLENPDFEDWVEGRPSAWHVGDGATGGGAGALRGKTSVVRKGDEGGLALEGASWTAVWKLVSQEVALKPDATYRLSFESRGTGLAREEGQFSSAYVGIARHDPVRPQPDFRWEMVRNGPWAPGEIVLRAAGSATASIRIFLSHTGRLEARGIRLEELAPRDSFDVLARHMGRYYSYFEHKGLDWASITARYRERALAAKDDAGFVAVLKEMLAELKDLHVTIRTPTGVPVATWSPAVPRNYDYRAVDAALSGPRWIGNTALVGDAAPGLGYLAVFTLQGSDAVFAEVERALEGLLDRRGLLLDLRANGGGDERHAQALAAYLADRPRLYAKHQVRAGPAPGDFSEPDERWIRPREGRRFEGPIVCLVGPGCVSSGEGFAKMLRALPNVTLVGLPTRGASGSPAPVELPNGVVVSFSRWVDMLPDGTVTEGKGVAPDRLVDHAGSGDSTFAAGVAALQEALAK
jgi:C-terminal processing protease CtpA/Prc